MSLMLRLNNNSLFPTDIFEDMWKALDADFATRRPQGFPKYDQYLEDGKWNIEMALAGYSKEQLSIEVDDGKLTVSALKSGDQEKKEGRVIARRSFSQSFSDPKRAWDLETAEVSYVDGLLKIVIPPKKPEQAPKKLLAIK